MNPTATTAHAPAIQKAHEDPGRSSVPGETALSAAEHGTPSLGNHALLETQMAILKQMAILNSLKSLKGESSTEESTSKVKEDDNINLPEFPNPETYCSWKTATREAVRAASDSPDEAFQWILQVYTVDTSHDDLRDPGKFLSYFGHKASSSANQGGQGRT